MNFPYEDIIHLPHHVSSKRPRMSAVDRAAQFSPFAALVGYDAAIQETGRLTTEKIELTEEEKSVLDQKQKILLERIAEHPEITVTYFLPDDRKNGGSYTTVTGNFKRIDDVSHVILLTDGTGISIDDILKIDSVVFEEHMGDLF